MFLGQTTSLLVDVGLPPSIDGTASDYTDTGEKVKKIRELIRTGTCDPEVTRYIQGVLKLIFQSMLIDTDTKGKPVRASYKDIEQLDFQMLLPDNHYVNASSICICFPMKIKKINKCSYWY